MRVYVRVCLCVFVCMRIDVGRLAYHTIIAGLPRSVCTGLSWESSLFSSVIDSFAFLLSHFFTFFSLLPLSFPACRRRWRAHMMS